MRSSGDLIKIANSQNRKKSGAVIVIFFKMSFSGLPSAEIYLNQFGKAFSWLNNG